MHIIRLNGEELPNKPEVTQMAEEVLHITGGKPLHGEVTVQGAKNSALPLMAATILCDGVTTLENVPRLTDVCAACRILNRVGCTAKLHEHTVTADGSDVHSAEIPDSDMRKMRSSIMFLGPLLGRMGACTLTMPGGCELGPRPIDLHLDAMRRMGTQISEENGRIVCRASVLSGAHIPLSYPSVGVTENVLMAAVCAKGETILTGAAREPEIVDLAGFLNCCGAKIQGAGESVIRIQGVKTLHGCHYRVMPDRIAAMTWLCAGASAGGTICVHDARPSELEACLAALEMTGCRIGRCSERIFLDAGAVLKPIRYLRTLPYPAFPTDAQAILMAVLCRAKGTSLLEETIFESRYKHVGELLRMGAEIRVSGKTAVIYGGTPLYSSEVEAMDLRGGAALAVAALQSEGTTTIRGLQHLDRGYENFAEAFHSLGADAKRVSFS